MDQDLRFTVDSALLRELGEKLVETVHVALSELVKNSYDADSTEVKIIFDTNDKSKTQIRIVDNGIGMSFETVAKYWMRIATTNKKDKDVSIVFGRPLTGAKGIGRFSCRRLGAKLKLITTGSKTGDIQGLGHNLEKTTVEFPWTDFQPGTDVTTITCKGEQEIIPVGYTGTTLIIEGVAKEWTTRGLNWLKRQLGVLVANRGTHRKGFKEDPGFNIKLRATGLEEGVIDLREEMINAGWGTLTASINSEHQAECKLSALRIGQRTIVSTAKFPALKDIELKIGIMVADQKQLRDKSIVSKGTLQSIISQWGGVQVRYRGIRVYPYGDDDWLDIDRDRGLRKLRSEINELNAFANSLQGIDPSRVLLNMLSMRNYIGSVQVGDKAAGFEMKLSREGFIESEAVIQLKEFVRYAIDWGNILREYYRGQEIQKTALIAKEEFEEILQKKVETPKAVDAALNYLEREVRTITRELKPSERKKVEQSFNKATEVIRKQNESNQSELNHLRLIASTSTLLLIFSHEIKSLLGLFEQSKNSLFRVASTLPRHSQATLENIGNDFSDLSRRLEELLQLTSLISTTKKKNKLGQVALKSRITKVVKVFELIINKYRIEVDYSNVPNNVVIKNILEAEVYSVLLNVFSNSIKAVIAGGKTKKIQISAGRLHNRIVIKVRDTGIGLDKEYYEDVFTPFLSDPGGHLYQNLEKRLNPEDNMIVGTGSGIGLGIVREIIFANGGSISFIKPTEGWSSEIEIKI